MEIESMELIVLSIHRLCSHMTKSWHRPNSDTTYVLVILAVSLILV
jgi:hypothetical protein